MSFSSNVGKPSVNPGPDQCEMINTHHPDCTCASCKASIDVQCLEPCVGTVGVDRVRVCGSCAIQQERDEFVVSYRDVTRFVLVHPEMGIYLGSAMGLGFWSKIDPVGQDAAVTFDDREQADLVMRCWDNGRSDGVVVWPVVPDQDDATDGPRTGRKYASVAACVAAGLPAWDPSA